METNASSRCSPRSLDSSLELLGKDGNYHCRVVIDQNRIRASCAEVWKKEEEKIKASLEIAFPILSRSRFKKNAEKNPNSFQFKVVKLSGAYFKIIIDSKEFREVAEKYEKGLSNERLSASSPEIIRLQADYCISDPIDGRERQKLLLSIVKKSRESDADERVVIAAVNAIEILIRSRFSFAEENLEKIKIPGSNLDEAMLYKAKMQRVDLSRSSLRRVYLKGADLREAKLEGVVTGLLKRLPLKDARGILQAQKASILAVWNREWLMVFEQNQGVESLLWKVSFDRVLNINSWGISDDGRWIVVNLGVKDTILLDVMHHAKIRLALEADSIYFSSDNQSLGIYSNMAGKLSVFCLQSQKLIGDFDLAYSLAEVKFSSDNRYLATVSESQGGGVIFRVWRMSELIRNPEPDYELLIPQSWAVDSHLSFSSKFADRLYLSIFKRNEPDLPKSPSILVVDISQKRIIKEIRLNGEGIRHLSCSEGEALLVKENSRIYQVISIRDQVLLVDGKANEEILSFFVSYQHSYITYIIGPERGSESFLCRYDFQNRRLVMRIPLRAVAAFEPGDYMSCWGDEGNKLYLIELNGQVVVIDVEKLGAESQANAVSVHGALITENNQYLAVWDFHFLYLFSLHNGVIVRTIALPFNDVQQASLILSGVESSSVGKSMLKKALTRLVKAQALNAEKDSLSAEDLGADFICFDDRIPVGDMPSEVFQGVLFKPGYGDRLEEEGMVDRFVVGREDLLDCCLNNNRSLMVTLSASSIDNSWMGGDWAKQEKMNILRIWDVSKHEIVSEVQGLPASKEVDVGKKEMVGISEDGRYVFVVEDRLIITVWGVEDNKSNFSMKMLWRIPYQFNCMDAQISSHGESDEEGRVLGLLESYGARRRRSVLSRLFSSLRIPS